MECGLCFETLFFSDHVLSFRSIEPSRLILNLHVYRFSDW